MKKSTWSSTINQIKGNNKNKSTTDTRTISATPKEVYGSSTEIKIRIGNGGAGPTGILRALAEDFIKKTGSNYSIAWYQDISPNTLKQLQNEKIDIALVYEKEQGVKALNEGWATNYTVIFNDHFLIVGPKANPANLKNTDSPEEAFKKIAQYGQKISQSVFLSRDDNSGTNVKEKSIWQKANLKPWSDKSPWYFGHHVFPKDALLYTDKHSFYSITDWGTWLSNKDELTNSTIYIQGGEDLLNACFALLGKNPSPETLDFLNYLKSEEAQNLIANFGKDKYQEGEKKLALFTRASQMDFELGKKDDQQTSHETKITRKYQP